MRYVFSPTPQNADAFKSVLEGLAEGMVQASMAEIDAAGQDEFPCCIKCGELRHFVGAIAGNSNRVLGPTELIARGGGTELDLAVFQAAQHRREGDTAAKVVVEYDGRGSPRIAVLNGDGTLEDPLDHVVKMEAQRNGCGCALASDDDE